jgi:hypothetical protein
MIEYLFTDNFFSPHNSKICKMNETRIHWILTGVLLFTINCTTGITKAQNIEELSKKELRFALRSCISEKDSIKQLEAAITHSSNNDRKKIIELSAQIGILQQTVNDYSKKLAEEEKKCRQIFSDLEESKKTIKHLNDSLKENEWPSSGNLKTDFLNSYFAKPYALNHAAFNLSFEKVMMGRFVGARSYWSEDEGRLITCQIFSDDDNSSSGFHQYLPEYINKTDIISNVKNIDSLLPRIEILKNKFVTFYYRDLSEENFLLNIYHGEENNFIKTLQLELASESVRADGSKNKEKDMIWKILEINNECYLMLTKNQLQRIKLPFKKFEDERNEGDKNGYVVFSRKTSVGTNNFGYINPLNLIFLFKLTPIK